MLLKERVDSIQALRAVAILLVVYTHALDSATMVFGSSLQSKFYYLKDWGPIGVDLFFAISGFIMTRVVESYISRGHWKSFIIKRILRIVPLYWLLTAVAILLKTYMNINITSLEIGKAFYFFPFLDKEEFIFPIMNVGWSLSYEVYFYLIIAVMIILVKPDNFLYKLIAFLVGACFIGLLFDYKNILYTFLTSSLLLEFAMGIVCGIVYDRIKRSKYSLRFAWVLVIVGTMTALSTILWKFKPTDISLVLENNALAIFRGVIWGVPCAMILLGSVLLEKNKSFKTPDFIKFLGDASYSNYLGHMFIINIATKFSHKIFMYSDAFSADLYIIILVIICTLVSAPIYMYIEKPLTKLTNRIYNTLGARQTICTSAAESRTEIVK
jgi:exopolysaccharide production protein ExoZ